tara:strand:- start:156 stop:845 length:690 start_codon:yes stop_codon:yes gene_type:complete
MKIAILNIATNNYKLFLNDLHDSIEKYFLTDYKKTYFVWSDDTSYKFKQNVHHIKIDAQGYPGDTLFRYHYFLMAKKELLEYDYVFYLDADMKIVDYVNNEIITDLLGIQHPGFWEQTKKSGTPESRTKSTAYVDPNNIIQYCCGGFNGGSSRTFLKMSETIAKNINIDAEKDIIAVWHDESHLNKYFSDHTPTKILDCGYCAPESAWDIPFAKKILALDKSVDKLKGR